MTYLIAIILGLIEGLTEFLPISSTGHLLLAERLFNLPSTDFLKTFDIAIQSGAILAVVFLYWRMFLDKELIKRLLTAFIPTGILGFVFYKFIKQVLMEKEIIIIISLFLGGLLLIIFELWHKEKEGAIEKTANISYGQSGLVGVFQSIAMIPGVSRSAITIIGGLLLGIKRKTIVEFSFLLAVPTMFAATGLDFLKSAPIFQIGDLGLLAVGFVVAFLSALASIKFLLSYIQKHNFIIFGVYRIVVALLFWFLIFK